MSKSSKSKTATPERAVKVKLKDLYQMLIEGNRYGFTRNNHLMPDGSFEHCKTYLPKMEEVDATWAVHTARQLADEAISRLTEDGLLYEDSRKFDATIHNGQQDLHVCCSWSSGGRQFEVSCDDLKVSGPITATVVDKEGSHEIVSAPDGDLLAHYLLVLYRKTEEGNVVTLSPLQKAPEPGEVVYVRIIPSFAGKQFDCQLYVEFIDWCLSFIKSTIEEHSIWDRTGGMPYNLEDYHAYLNDRPWLKHN